MRVLRVLYSDQTFYASMTQDSVICLNRSLGLNEPIPLEKVRILPLVMPTKIVCAAINYRAHGEEVGLDIPEEPRIFLKPPSAVIGNGQPILIPYDVGRVDYEGELAIVIGRVCRNISPDDIPSCIFGYTCANDVTARDLQKKDGNYGRAKGFDTFAPIGPWIETDVDDPLSLTLRTTVNGQVVQEASTSEMLVGPLELVSYISGIMTLTPGDVILTGTPGGSGPLAPGDEVRVEIDRIGVLINKVQLTRPTERKDLQ